MTRDPLGLAAGVDEHERGAVLAHELGEAVVHLRPHLSGHHRLERCSRDLELQIALAGVPGIDDGAGGAAVIAQVARANEKACHFLDGLLRGGQSDTAQPAPGERLEPLDCERQVYTALGGNHGVDLIDDHGARACEHLPPGLRAHEDVERLGCGHHDVWRTFAHRGALVLRRVAGAHEGADVDFRQTARGQLIAYAGERGFEVALDVVGECLERGYVNDPRLIRQAARGAFTHELIDHREEGRQGLAGARRSGDQDVALRNDLRPCLALRRSRCVESAVEPAGDRWVEVGGHRHD